MEHNYYGTENIIPDKTMSQLIEDVGSWATKNFVSHAPPLGILEEVGEIAHGILKHLQKIRGFENEEKFQTHIMDGFADAMIFLCHTAYLHGAFFAFNRNCHNVMPVSSATEYYMISNVLQSLSALMNQEARDFDSKLTAPEIVNLYNLFCQRLCNALEIWASSYQINLKNATLMTWHKIVSKRDWNKDAKEGGGHKHD